MSILFCIIVGLLFSLNPINDNDFFWHSVVGSWISNNHTIPNVELFSWASGEKWVAHEWLTELIMYKLGPVGCLVTMLLIFILLYILMAKMLKLKFKRVFDFKLVYFLIMCIFFKVTGPRPYILSLVFFAYLVYVLFSYLDDKKWAHKLIWTLPVLQIIWVNLHGGSSSLIYIFLIGVLLCHYFLKIIPIKNSRWTDFTLSKTQLKTIYLLLLLVLIATCINPFGYEMLLYPFTNMTDTSMTSYIVEWNSPSFHNLLGLYIFLMIVIPLFNLIMQNKKMKLHEIGFQLVLLYMCLKSQRFIGMYGIYSTWTLGKYFLIDKDTYKVLSKPFIKYIKPLTIAFSILLITIIGVVGYKQISTFKDIGIIDNDGFYTDEAVKKLIELKPERLFNDYSQGGYLLYKLNEYNSDIKIFSYGLGDVFSKDLLPDTVNLSDLYTNPRDILNKYNFDYMITTKNHTLHYYLDECNDYKLIYDDGECFIYEKIQSF